MILWTGRQFQEMIDKPLPQAEEGRSFLENNVIRLLLGLSGFVLLVLAGILIFFFRPSEVLTVLHYNVYFGVDLLGAWWQMYILPGVALVFVFVNMWLSYHFYERRRERIIAYLLLLGVLMLLSGVTIGCIAMAYINY